MNQGKETVPRYVESNAKTLEIHIVGSIGVQKKSKMSQVCNKCSLSGIIDLYSDGLVVSTQAFLIPRLCKTDVMKELPRV